MSTPKPAARRSPALLLRKVRRAILARRRLLAALLVGVAVLAGLRATAAPPPATTPILVAARDLPTGVVLSGDDLAWREFAPDTAPAGALAATEATGRPLAGPMRAGEPVTDLALVGPGLAANGQVVAPVRITDAESVGLLGPGDRIDLVATDLDDGTATRVASGVSVLAVPAADPAAGDGMPGRLVVVALDPAAVVDVTAASTRDGLGFNFSG